MQFRRKQKSNKTEQENNNFEKEQKEAFKHFMKVHFNEEISCCKVAYSFDENEE